MGEKASNIAKALTYLTDKGLSIVLKLLVVVFMVNWIWPDSSIIGKILLGVFGLIVINLGSLAVLFILSLVFGKNNK